MSDLIGESPIFFLQKDDSRVYKGYFPAFFDLQQSNNMPLLGALRAPTTAVSRIVTKKSSLIGATGAHIDVVWEVGCFSSMQPGDCVYATASSGPKSNSQVATPCHVDLFNAFFQFVCQFQQTYMLSLSFRNHDCDRNVTCFVDDVLIAAVFMCPCIHACTNTGMQPDSLWLRF